MNKPFRFLGIAIIFSLFAASAFCASAQSCYRSGQEKQNEKSWYEAVEFYLEAVQINPAYGDAWFGLAQCSYEMGEYDLALSYLDTASRFIKNRPELKNLKGYIYISKNQLKDAETQFQEVLQAFPNNVDARFGLAELDVLDGRINGAEDQFLQALQRQTTSCPVLLSLALVCEELGKLDEAEAYINRALTYHSGNGEVYYLAAYLAKKQGNLEQAENYVRTAVKLDDSMDDGYKLLSTILYDSGRYEEAIDICTYRISRNRNASDAWYLKGLALSETGRVEEAFAAYETGLEMNPEDEVMRCALELLAFDNTRLEDSRRAGWAEWHLKKAKEYEEKYFSAQAAYEYQRCLRLNPFDIESRQAYADIMLTDGYPEAYLSHMEFIQGADQDNIRVNDIVEGYRSLLYSTLSSEWGIDPFYLDKTRWQVGLYYQASEVENIHSEVNRVTALMLEDIFTVSSAVNLVADPEAAVSFTDAFQRSRKNGEDYFCLLSVNETEREISISCNMYSSRTGNAAGKWTVYRTGNSRYANALQKLRQSMLKSMPYYAVIVARSGADVVIDAGRLDGVTDGEEWTIVKPDSIKTADFGLGITFQDKNILGTVKISKAGEDISEGVYTQKGFYDLMNVGDIVMLIKADEPEENNSSQSSQGVVISQEYSSQEPELVRMLRIVR